jgi:hypothetical protein
VNPDVLLRIAALCVVLAGAETLHGIARTTLVIPRMGKARALKLSAVTGTLLALAICWLLVPGINLQSARAHLILGVVLAGFMASFDIAIGISIPRRATTFSMGCSRCASFRSWSGMQTALEPPLRPAACRGLRWSR